MVGSFLSFRFNSVDTSLAPWTFEVIGNEVETVPDLKQLTVLWVRKTNNYSGGKGVGSQVWDI